MFKEKIRNIPGFRSGAKWKMVLATIGYLLLLITLFATQGLTMQDKIVSIVQVLLFSSVFIIFIGNVGDIRSKLPLFKKKSVASNILGGFVVLILLGTVIGAIGNLHTPEQLAADALSVEQADDKEIATAIDEQITELGKASDLTYENIGSVNTVLKDYEALTSDQKSFVTKVEDLKLLEKKAVELETLKIASGLDARITKLGDPNAITYNKLDEIKAIRVSYDKLKPEEQKLVTKLDAFISIESKIPELQAAADKAAAEKVEAARIKAEQAAVAEAEAAYQSWISAQFSAWDGSNTYLVRLVKDNLNDPGSFEHSETVYWDKGDYIIVKMTYRATNGFGALVLQNVTAKADYATDTISIISQND